MISVLTIGSLYWSSQHPINRETGYSNVQSILGHLGPFLPLGAILGKSSLNDHWSTNSTERSGPNQACHAKDIARQSARQVLAILGQYELLWAIWTTLGHLVWEGWCIWSPVSLWPPWTHLAIYIIRTAIVDANVAQPGRTVEHNNGGRPNWICERPSCFLLIRNSQALPWHNTPFKIWYMCDDWLYRIQICLILERVRPKLRAIFMSVSNMSDGSVPFDIKVQGSAKCWL